MSTNYKIGVDIAAKGANATVSEIGKVDKALNKAGKSSSLTDFVRNAKAEFGGLSSLAEKAGGAISVPFAAAAGPIGIAATAIAGLGVATIGAGAALFSITKELAAAGTEIKNFQNLTGLSAESISTIKVASEAAGVSLDNFEEVWESFIETLIEGGQGSEEAGKKLRSAGIDAATGFKDVEGSVKKGFDAIRNARTQAEKSAIAMNVFGESGLNIVKVASEMEGGFDAFKQKLVETGAAFTEDGIRQAKEYDKQLKELDRQLAGVGRTIGAEVLPVFLDLAKESSLFLTENKAEIKEWAGVIKSEILVAIDFFRKLKAAYDFLAAPRSTNFSNFGQVVEQPKLPEAIAPAPVKIPAPEITIGKAATDDLFSYTANLEKSAKHSKALSDVTEDLKTQIRFFGDESQAASVKQKLLKAGITDFNSEAAKAVLILAKKADAMKKDKAQTDAALSSITALSTQIQFFGDESQVAATKQSLMSAGFSSFDSGLAKTAVSLARQLDKLKATKKEQDEYKTSLKGLSDEMKGLRDNAAFEIAFPKATELDRFENWVKRNTANFADLNAEIEATRSILSTKATFDGINLLIEGGNDVLELQKGIRAEVDRTIRGISDQTDPFLAQIEQFAEGLLTAKNIVIKAQALSPEGINVFPQDFAAQIDKGITAMQSFKTERDKALASGDLNAASIAFGKYNQKWLDLKTYVEGVADIKIFDKDGNFLNTMRLFGEKGADKFIEKMTALKAAIKDSELKKGTVELNRLFEDLGLKVGDVGFQSDLDKLNAKLSDPAIVLALQKEAAAAGYTIEQYKELIRLKAQMNADPRSTGTRPRVVGPEPQKGFGATVGAGLRAEFGLGNIGIAIKGAQDEATANAAAMKAVYQDLGMTVVDVFGSMAGAAQDALANFILTGEGGAQAFASLAASAIANLAVQSGIKALFEYAEGAKESALSLASAAVGDARGAALHGAAAKAHFSAATMYAAIGGGAAIGGIGIGLAGGLSGGGKGKDKDQSDQPDYQTAKNSNINTDKNIRQTNGNIGADPTTAKLINRIQALGESFDAMNAKLKGMKAGDILTVGADQKPGFFADRTTSELSRDSTKVRKMGNALNLK
jgi:hypothetical protein